jgi:HK97 family phage portal protein
VTFKAFVGRVRDFFFYKAAPQNLSSVNSQGGWWPLVREPYAGAWQQNVTIDVTTVLSHPALFACATLIASDVAKMRLKLVQQRMPGLWVEAENVAYGSVIRKPNHYQNRIQFYESWVLSKNTRGNTYVLKSRDNRSVVDGMYVLDPLRCRPLVAPNGDVFYELKTDNLSAPALEQIPTLEGKQIVAPATEVIHDRMNTLFHPLVGIAPIYACGLAAMQGIRIQENSTVFFSSGSNPGGVLTAPGFINDDTAKRLKKYWEENFTGANVGKVAILGDGLKFEKMSVNAVDSQLIEQDQSTSLKICTAYKVPPYKIGIGPYPNTNSVEALDQQYYSQCLQIYLEAIEICLDEGLGMARDGAPQEWGTEFDLDDLMRMDTATLVRTASESLKGGMSPNEARRKFFGLGPVTGGDSPYLQQQNFSLEALAKRDAQDDPFASKSSSTPAPAPQSSGASDDTAAQERDMVEMLRKELGLAA